MHVRDPPTAYTPHKRNEDSDAATPYAQHNGPGDDVEKRA